MRNYAANVPKYGAFDSGRVWRTVFVQSLLLGTDVPALIEHRP